MLLAASGECRLFAEVDLPSSSSQKMIIRSRLADCAYRDVGGGTNVRSSFDRRLSPTSVGITADQYRRLPLAAMTGRRCAFIGSINVAAVLIDWRLGGRASRAWRWQNTARRRLVTRQCEDYDGLCHDDSFFSAGFRMPIHSGQPAEHRQREPSVAEWRLSASN